MNTLCQELFFSRVSQPLPPECRSLAGLVGTVAEWRNQDHLVNTIVDMNSSELYIA